MKSHTIKSMLMMPVLFIAHGAAAQDKGSMAETVDGLKEPLDLYSWGGSSTMSYSENDYLKGILVMDVFDEKTGDQIWRAPPLKL